MNNICPLMKSLIQSLNPELLKECLSESQITALSPQPTTAQSTAEERHFILENLNDRLKSNDGITSKALFQILKKHDDDLLGYFDLSYIKEYVKECEQDEKECEQDEEENLFVQLDKLLDKITDLDMDSATNVMDIIEKCYGIDSMLYPISQYDIADYVTNNRDVLEKVMESLDGSDILDYYDIDDLVSHHDDCLSLVNKEDLKREIEDIIDNA